MLEAESRDNLLAWTFDPTLATVVLKISWKFPLFPPDLSDPWRLNILIIFLLSPKPSLLLEKSKLLLTIVSSENWNLVLFISKTLLTSKILDAIEWPETLSKISTLLVFDESTLIVSSGISSLY